MKIALYGDGVFLGYKTDTFWTLSKDSYKRHDKIHGHLVDNLLSILNNPEWVQYYPFKDSREIALKLLDKDDNILEERIVVAHKLKGGEIK